MLKSDIRSSLVGIEFLDLLTDYTWRRCVDIVVSYHVDVIEIRLQVARLGRTSTTTSIDIERHHNQFIVAARVECESGRGCHIDGGTA